MTEETDTISPEELQNKKLTRMRITTALLAFFSGSFGVHKFYMRKDGAGLIYLGITILGCYLLFQDLVASGIWQKLQSMAGDPLAMQAAIQKMDVKLSLPTEIACSLPTLMGIFDGVMALMMSNAQFAAANAQKKMG